MGPLDLHIHGKIVSISGEHAWVRGRWPQSGRGDRKDKQQVTGPKVQQSQKGPHMHTGTRTPLQMAGGPLSGESCRLGNQGAEAGGNPPTTYCLGGPGFQFEKMKKLLEKDGGTTMEMSSVPLNCPL